MSQARNASKTRKGTKGKSRKDTKKQRRKRPTQQEIKARRQKYRAAQKALRRRELEAGLERSTKPATPNRVSPYATKEEEAAERLRVAQKWLDAIRPQLPALLESLSEIEDYRDPKKVEHELTMVLLFGILCFVLQMASRREGNRELTGPVLRDHLRELFPSLDKLPHQDTLNRILSNIDVEKIQESHLQMIRRLVRNKKLNRFLVQGCYPIAVDGTQKHARDKLLSPEWQQRTINKGKDTERQQYYVYVLEASFAFPNGFTLPLFSEFLSYKKGDTANDKQDCEQRAFKRLARRLKKEFPRLPIMLLLDGLYPSGPVMEIGRRNHWQFMIVLKDDSLPSVWEDYRGLITLEPGNKVTLTWGNRNQVYRWMNGMDYRFGNKKRQIVNLVECTETWTEIDPKTHQEVEKASHHAWISSEPLTKGNLHQRCNLAARHRWNIEEGFLVEKHHGYRYEHCFSQNWQAMLGYHYLMHLGHALNVLAQYSEALIQFVQQKGVRGFIKFIRDSLCGPWFDPASLEEGLASNPQLRLA
jgi:hypothetical protein